MSDLLIVTAKGVDAYNSNREVIAQNLSDNGIDLKRIIIACDLPIEGFINGNSFCPPHKYGIVDAGDTVFLESSKIFKVFENIYTVTSNGVFKVMPDCLVPVAIDEPVKKLSELDELLPNLNTAFNHLQRVTISKDLIANINPDLLTVRDAWSLVCLEAALHNTVAQNANTRLYKCDVDNLPEDCDNVTEALIGCLVSCK